MAKKVKKASKTIPAMMQKKDVKKMKKGKC